MVKGVSKQVIVVQSPDRKLYDQAIFILSDQAMNNRQITDNMILQEANRLIRNPRKACHSSMWSKLIWCSIGASAVGLFWLCAGYL